MSFQPPSQGKPHPMADYQSIRLSELEQLFEKKFHYQKPRGNESWQLPPQDQALFSEFYQFEALQGLREQLNAIKSKLNDYGVQEWSAHTNRRDPSGEVSWRLKNDTKAEFVTVAWCKFFECLHRYPLVKTPVVNTLHLCEAPGAFIASLNHYLHSVYSKDEIKWNWRSTTLNPYYEGNALNQMISDDRFIFHTLDHWLFHKDLTGNLLDVDNIDHLAERCAEDLKGQVDLVTADGSIDCAAQPDCQEEIVVRLFFAEVLSALKILSNGGSFLVKMFTLFEACSVSLLYSLNCIFEQVHIFKPATSKRGNSEVYVICLNYQKDTPGLPRLLEEIKAKLAQPNDTMVMPLFARSQIPQDFLMQHEIACRLYMKLQADAIEGSIYAYESNDRHYLRHLHHLRGLVSNTYYSRYKVKPLEDSLCIVDKEATSKALGFSVPVYGGSYTERENLKHGDLLKQIYCLRREFNQLEKCPSGRPTYSYVKNRVAPLNLRVARGAPVQSLQSSLFASEPILLLRLRILDTFDLDPVWQTAPKCQLDATTLNYLPPSENQSFHSAQQCFFVDLLEAVREKQPQSIVFHKFLFLTHYAASLLLFLMESIYEECSFDSHQSQTLTLSKLKAMESKELGQVLMILKDEQAGAIHSLLEIKELQKNQFSNALIQHNNNVLLTCFRGMLGEESFPMPPLSTSKMEVSTIQEPAAVF
ncbi:cap-specific mRNA (nucleoside-2'-O-)-methyltransferase 2 [Drosophila subpulchrella]|uniref:cap-specific mRNA (nucleoside-2'-O-)-methyltransferase 2 n=1 Tax=Drosophila subpulchrella TaxID=1486046 RepID=UPI0018A13126|nr:cap-specific mRNA (nucleoside-2'-O-)-methyltransferase 2 [Drosophila subpulchrella]